MLFIVTNLAVMLVLGIAASLLGVNRYLTANGLQLVNLLGFALLMGFGGATISLLMSKPMAKWTTGAQVINDCLTSISAASPRSPVCPIAIFHARRAFQPAMPRRRERGDVEVPLPITAQVPTKESS